MALLRLHLGILFVFSCVVMVYGECETCVEVEGKTKETTQKPNTIVAGYDKSLRISKILETDDKKLFEKWAEDFQIMRLDTALKYRLQMIRHQEHNFKSNGNVKWMECQQFHRKDLKGCMRYYLDSERKCLKLAIAMDSKYKETAENYGKQIIKWRRGYRYLSKVCKDENPNNKENNQECLIQYMQNDSFDEVIHRLIKLKQRAVSDLYDYYNESLIELENCLRGTLTEYLDKIRSIIEILDKCYKIKNVP